MTTNEAQMSKSLHVFEVLPDNKNTELHKIVFLFPCLHVFVHAPATIVMLFSWKYACCG